ncbi:MAG TPA: hypothetical protein PKI94_02660 [Candidatus Gastranaerophilaceae bacterium]|nr:hypothetical protein [Candidatus Gastranaerophilaceae bacterium]
MSKVNLVQQVQSTNFKEKPLKKPQVSFKGKEDVLTAAQELIVEQALKTKYLGFFGRTLDYFSKTAGEIQNLLLIGFGTAFVAPIFIAYNSLSKQDPKKKKYSAMRQPISAVIATALGFGINKPIADGLSKACSEGALEKFDMSAKPQSDFLKARYNSIVKNFGKLKDLDKKYFEKAGTQDFKDVKAFREKFPTFQHFEQAVHKTTLEEVAQKLLSESSQNSIKNQTLRDFLIKNMDFEKDCIDEKMLNPYMVKSKLEKTTAIDFLRKIGFDDATIDEKSLRKALNRIISTKGFDSNQKDIIEQIAENLITEEAKGKNNISMKALFNILGIEKDFHQSPVLDSTLDKFMLTMHEMLSDSTSSSSRKTFTETLKEFNVKKILTENDISRLKNFAKQLAKNSVDDATTAFKAYTKAQGIVLSLITLPFACGFLNWSYPRIMDKFFPQLCPAKKPQEGGKTL